MNVLLFCERLAPPFDEGIKNVAVNLIREFLNTGHSVQGITVDGAESSELPLLNLHGVNRALLSRRLSRSIKAFSPDRVCYIPTASMTAAAFLRCSMLRRHSDGASVTMVVLQPRNLAWWGKVISAHRRPDLVLAFSSSTARLLAHLGGPVACVSVGVDARRFSPLDPQRRERARAALGIPAGCRVALHVGHLHRGRNLGPLKKLQELERLQILLLPSSVQKDFELADELLKSGVRILQGQVPPPELIYGLSDLYLFTCPAARIPERSPAIDLPLSVFEAMACNLPVVTTCFGGLPDLFADAPGFRYVSDPLDNEEWKEKVSGALRGDPGGNRQKVLPHTWDALARRALGTSDG